MIFPMTRCTIIIPAYNEAAVIEAVVNKLRAARPHDEILVIDDGSNDATAPLAQKAGARVIHHKYNMGYGASLKTGMRHAASDTLVFFDGDGQHNPQDIQKLIDQLESNDMVVGARPKGSGAISRRSGKWFLYRVAEYLVGRKIPDLNSGLRTLRRSLALELIHLLPNGFSLTTTITLAMMSLGYQVEYVPIQIQERSGKSTVSIRDFFRTIMLILRMITLFAPLKIFIPTAITLAFIAIPSLTYDLLHTNISDTTVVLWLFCLIIFLFGLLADSISVANRKGTKQ